MGLEPGSWLEVDDTCMVRAVDERWLYTLGDINRHALLTHQGKYQARIAGAAIAAHAAGRPLDTARGAPTRSPPTTHFRRPGRGGTDPLGHRRGGGPGPGQPALARRALFPSISEVWPRLLEAYRG